MIARNCSGNRENREAQTQSEMRRRSAGKPIIEIVENGAPGRIRTSDLVLRRHTLYPSELRARRLRREGLRERKWEAYSVILLCFLCCGKINRDSSRQ